MSISWIVASQPQILLNVHIIPFVRGELLRRAVASSPGAVGIGVDNSVDMLSAWPDYNKSPGVTPVDSDLEEYIDTFLSKGEAEECFDVIFCVGALPAGKQRNTIQKLRCMLKPSGALVIGELIWVSGPPSSEFIDNVGVSPTDYCSLEELKTALRGDHSPPECEVIAAHTVSVEKYETQLLENVQNWALLNSDDEDAEKILSVSLAWNDFGRRVAWNTWEFSTVVARRC